VNFNSLQNTEVAKCILCRLSEKKAKRVDKKDLTCTQKSVSFGDVPLRYYWLTYLFEWWSHWFRTDNL